MPQRLPPPVGVTARALAKQLGVSRDTLFTWVSRGLLPAPTLHGAATRYGASYQLRAKVVAKLREQGVAYDAIATALAVSDEELIQRDAPPPPPPPPVEVHSPEASPTLPTWQRVELLPGLELHVASSVSAFVRRIADEVIARYRATAPE